MNHSLAPTPLEETTMTKERMERWVKAQVKGERLNIDVYGKPADRTVKELENIRSLSKELQENLKEIETSIRVADVENQAMNPTAPILDFSEDHEFVSANQLDNYYSVEDQSDAKEEEKRRLTSGKGRKTEIQRFYKDQCVFLTGGTGFLGKVLIEKLLRTCGDIDTIYVMIRTKKGKDATARLHELLDDFLFHKAHEMNPKGIHKVVPIVGDMQLPGLGISEEDRKLLTSKVTIIINAAATVKFDEKLGLATAINVCGTRAVLGLARECRHLLAVTHISTAFANTHRDCVEERFYEPPMAVEALEAVADLDENVLDQITPAIIGNRPNTYCFTKAVAEEAVRRYGEGMPICVVRPSIVISTYEEPVRGWTDSLYGPAGIMVGIGTGVVRTVFVHQDKVADMVPVDLTVNAILASAWHTAKEFKENQTSDIPIYNFVSGAQNPITWANFIEMNRKYGITKPTTKAVWYYGLNITDKYYLFLFYNFFLHYLPALLIDMMCLLLGKRRRMLRTYSKIMKLAHILFYFSVRDWQFHDDNVQGMWRSLSERDRVLFPFSLGEMSWDTQIETLLLGLRVYVVKDDLSSLPEATKRWNRLYYMHQTVKLVTLALVINLVYYGIQSVFGLLFA